MRFIPPVLQFILTFSRKVRGKFAESHDRKEKKCETGGFAHGGAKLVVPDLSRGTGTNGTHGLGRRNAWGWK